MVENSKTLKTVQVLSKIAKILSKVVFVCCIVGFCGCVVGIISLALGVETVKIGDVSIKSIIKNESGLSVESLYCIMIVGMILCAGEGVLSEFAAHYFAREYSDGTPFTFGGAKELFRLGILGVCIPLGTQTICAIVVAVFKASFSDISSLNLDGSMQFTLGVMFIIGSLLCKLGAETIADGNGGNAKSGEKNA